jgi:hypothetical protein
MSYSELEQALIQHTIQWMINELNLEWSDTMTIDTFLTHAMEKARHQDEAFYNILAHWKQRIEHIVA